MTSSNSLDDLDDSFEIVDLPKDEEPQLSVEEQQTTVDEKKEDAEAETFEQRLEKLRKMELVRGFNVVTLFRYFLYLEICLGLYIRYACYIPHNYLVFFAGYFVFPIMIFLDIASLYQLKTRQRDSLDDCCVCTMLARGLLWWICLCSGETLTIAGYAVYFLSTALLDFNCLKSLKKTQEYLGTVAKKDKETSAKLLRELDGPSLSELASRAIKKIGKVVGKQEQTTMNEEEKEKEEKEEEEMEEEKEDEDDEEGEDHEESEAIEFEKRLQELKQMELVKGLNVVSLYHCCLYLNIALAVGYTGYAFSTLNDYLDIMTFFCGVIVVLPCLLWADIDQLIELKSRRPARSLGIAHPEASVFTHLMAGAVMFFERPKCMAMALYCLYVLSMLILNLICTTSLETIQAHLRPLTRNDEDKLLSSLENERPYCFLALVRYNRAATEKIEKSQ